MQTVKFDDRMYFKSELLEEMPEIVHCFTSKNGGESRGKISGLNLGFRVGDDYNAVVANYRLVAKDLGFSEKRMTAAKQTHSTDIVVVTDENAGSGVSRLSETFEADGLVTNLCNTPVGIFYADCVPILLVDNSAGVVAAVHSGWRGTVGNIAENAIKVMCEKFGALPENIIAAIGPSIGPCCFETGAEVATEFDEDLCKSLPDGKFKVDLWEANRRILLGCGVLPENIDVFGLCTICRNDILYSYRTHKDKTGRMGAFIMIKEDRE